MDTDEIIEGLKTTVAFIEDIKYDIDPPRYMFLVQLYIDHGNEAITKLQEQEEEINNLNAIVDHMLEEN